MRIVDCKQGTPEWFAKRVGRPTASRFPRIITEKKGGYSSAAPKFIAELLGEQYHVAGLRSQAEEAAELGEAELVAHLTLVADTFAGFDAWDGNAWTDRGTDLEPTAASWYELTTGLDARAVGMVERDDGLAACSPDRLVGDDGVLEIKNLGAKHHWHVLTGVEPMPATRQQVQSTLWITERDWCDQLAYSPAFPPVLLRTPRDEPYIAQIAACFDRFTTEMERTRHVMDALGPRGRRDDWLERLLEASVATQADAAGSGAVVPPQDDEGA